MYLSDWHLWDHGPDGLMHHRRGFVLLCNTKSDAAVKSLNWARADGGAPTEAWWVFANTDLIR
jgi:hypothetical protein